MLCGNNHGISQLSGLVIPDVLHDPTSIPYTILEHREEHASDVLAYLAASINGLWYLEIRFCDEEGY